MCSRFTALSRHQVVEVPPGAIRSAARSHLHALIGDVTLKPIDGVLWAHPTPNAKGLTEVRPLDGLSINSPKMVAGAGLIRISLGSILTPPGRPRRLGRPKRWRVLLTCFAGSNRCLNGKNEKGPRKGALISFW